MGAMALKAADKNAMQASAGSMEERCAQNCRARALSVELQKSTPQPGDLHAIKALGFWGCPDVALRPRLWQVLLGIYTAETEETRYRYGELQSKAVAALGSLWECSGNEGIGFNKDVEADVRAVWRDEVFLSRPDVMPCIDRMTRTLAFAANKSQPIPHSGVLATLLLYVMSHEGSDATLDKAERDAFFCLLHIHRLLPAVTADDAGLTSKARRLQLLLQAYDPSVAEVIVSHNLGELLATRLSVALCARIGFTLQQCAQVWDRLLADPRRFEFSDYFVVALVLSKRRELLRAQNDAGAVAEAILAAPKGIGASFTTLLNISCAICALERRCGPNSETPFPPRPGVLDVVANAAASSLTAVRDTLGSAWGQLRVRGKDALQGFRRRTQEDSDQRSVSTKSTKYGAMDKCSTILGSLPASSRPGAVARGRRAQSLDRTALEAGLV